jgi:mRNA interferase RelE/StbE
VASYSVLIKRSVAKELERLQIKDRRRMVSRIGSLARDPRPPGCEKLSGEEKYRLRQGSMRVVYEVSDGSPTVTVVKIGHRRDVYR